MTRLLPGVKRENLAPAADPGEGVRVAREAARQLKDVYGERLLDVVLFGSWVHGAPHEESDVDLLVVLDEVADRAKERDRIVEVLFDLEVDSHRAIQAFPVARADARSDRQVFVGAALRDGTTVLEGSV